MFDPKQVGLTLGPLEYRVNPRDVILYHLGIGARAEQLDWVYERAPGGLKVCPSYAVIPTFSPFMDILRRLKIDLRTVLHGEEAIELHRPIPAAGKLLTTVKVAAIYDKKKAALVILETETTDADGQALFDTRAGLFCRGLGGWGGDPGPRGESFAVPDRSPDFILSQQTGPDQAALYRLSGDVNPLHIDPKAARAAGFARPILHGLCTFGFATRAVVEGACEGEIERLQDFRVRFAEVVFPGETITTRGWRMDDGRYHIEAATERAVVLSHACVRVKG